MRMLVLMVCAFLGACQTCQPLTVVETQEVKVPVAIKCKVKRPMKPQGIDPAILQADTYDKVVAIMRENVDLLAYSKELNAALDACSEPE